MGALLLALGVVAGIVKLAFSQQEDPSIRRALEKRRLIAIARKKDKHVTLSEAEDALILAKRHEQKLLVTRFAKLVFKLKTSRRHP